LMPPSSRGQKKSGRGRNVLGSWRAERAEQVGTYVGNVLAASEILPFTFKNKRQIDAPLSLCRISFGIIHVTSPFQQKSPAMQAKSQLLLTEDSSRSKSCRLVSPWNNHFTILPCNIIRMRSPILNCEGSHSAKRNLVFFVVDVCRA
jgi:hypothetical protein